MIAKRFRISGLMLLSGLLFVCFGTPIVLLLWSPTPEPLPQYPGIIGTVVSYAEQRGISNILTMTFETADTLQTIEAFYMVAVPRHGIPFNSKIPIDGSISLNFVYDRERFPFAGVFTHDSRWVTSVSIMAQTIAPNRTRVTIEQTESLTYPHHVDEFPSLTP
jgi:hypothetical protein